MNRELIEMIVAAIEKRGELTLTDLRKVLGTDAKTILQCLHQNASARGISCRKENGSMLWGLSGEELPPAAVPAIERRGGDETPAFPDAIRKEAPSPITTRYKHPSGTNAERIVLSLTRRKKLMTAREIAEDAGIDTNVVQAMMPECVAKRGVSCDIASRPRRYWIGSIAPAALVEQEIPAEPKTADGKRVVCQFKRATPLIEVERQDDVIIITALDCGLHSETDGAKGLSILVVPNESVENLIATLRFASE